MKKVLVIAMLIMAAGLVGCPPPGYYEHGRYDEDRGYDYDRGHDYDHGYDYDRGARHDRDHDRDDRGHHR